MNITWQGNPENNIAVYVDYCAEARLISKSNFSMHTHNCCLSKKNNFLVKTTQEEFVNVIASPLLCVESL